MNNDLISREALKEMGVTCFARRNENGKLEAIISIDNAPTVEVDKLILIVAKRHGKREMMLNALRPHGKWIDREAVSNTTFPFWERYECNKCHKYNGYSNYCPNCGAKMDAEVKSHDRDNRSLLQRRALDR